MKKLSSEVEGKMCHKSNTQAMTVKLDNNNLTINILIYYYFDECLSFTFTYNFQM